MPTRRVHPTNLICLRVGQSIELFFRVYPASGDYYSVAVSHPDRLGVVSTLERPDHVYPVPRVVDWTLDDGETVQVTLFDPLPNPANQRFVLTALSPGRCAVTFHHVPARGRLTRPPRPSFFQVVPG